jgi:hypothetical protein
VVVKRNNRNPLPGFELPFVQSVGSHFTDHIKMNLRETGCQDRGWMHLAQDRDQWQALVNTVMNFVFNKCKDKVVSVLNKAPRHEDVLESGGIAPRIL